MTGSETGDAAVVEASAVRIRPMTSADWSRVTEIYRAGIETGGATFETEVPSWEAWDAGHLEVGRRVAVDAVDAVIGWAALSPVSGRCVYRGVAEVSVYVAPSAHGRGVGTRLLEALVEASEEAGIWTLEASMFPENEASVRVHERSGFRRVGRREALGELGGRWRDVLLLERRSDRVGRPRSPEEQP